MKKKIVIVLSVIAVVVVGLLAFAATLPGQFKVERSVLISAAPEKIYPYINSPKKMNTWNPWLEADRNAKLTYAGPEEGVGAKNFWEGNSDIGAGSAEIIENRGNEIVKVRLVFTRPMEGTNMAQYFLQSEGDQTKMSWAMTGENNLIARLFCFFFNGEKMIGDTFEKGLNTLKTMVEGK